MWSKCLALIICGSVVSVSDVARAAMPGDPDLSIYYTFDEIGKVVADQSGKGHDGTVHGDVGPYTEKGRRAIHLKGTLGPTGLSYLDLQGADFPAQDIPKSAVTLAAWLKVQNTGNHHAIFNTRAADATWVVHPEVRSENNFRWLLRAAGSSMLFDIRAGTVPWDEWVHYAGTYDKATVKATLYINGEIVKQETVATPKDIAGDWGSGARVGINVDNARPLTGVMDEFYLFKRALSQAEVRQVLVVPSQLKAYAPEPPDKAPQVVMPLFRWSAGDTAVLHTVYLGASPELGEADLVALAQTTTMYWHLPVLTPGATYYWRVDEIEVDGKTIHQGDVWSFTAAVLAASEPSPRNGAKWIDVNADLAWAPGAGTLTHDVYFGTDKAAVEAGDPAVFKGNQMAVSYDPGALASNTTYYWRVDEHADNDVLYKGPLWSFTTIGPGTGVKAQYFKGAELAGAPILTQVEDSINHAWGDGVVAAGVSDGVSARWTADLEAPFTETFELITTSDDGVKLWLDGRLIISDWRSHGSTDDIVKVDLIAGQVYSLVMEWYDGSGSALAKLWWQSPSIRRQIIPAGPLQLPVRATNPYPGNTAVNADPTLPLRWSPGGSAAGHDVYFGDSAEAVADATAATAGVYRGRQKLEETTFDPGGLEWNKTCYWRIDEVNDANPAGPWKGVVWSFTTADFIVVDDFESYTDEDGHRIYQTWIDGYADGSSGSVVGYMEAPFAEQKIVHSGKQSMPLDYNNVTSSQNLALNAASPPYSEAVREWSVPQNWTVNGCNTLVLHVRGKAANGVASLYAAVEDSSGHIGTVVHPDAAITTSMTWVEWRIPLSQFAGVGMTRVKKLYVGLGDRANPTPGGAGTIYIDDIWIIRE